MAANEDWRTPAFRQKVISQIEEAVKRSGNPNVMMKNPAEMESQVYSKAKTRVDYLAYVARLLVYIRDIRPTAPGQQQAPAANMNQQPGMRPQFPSPQLSKPQTVSTMGAQGNLQQVPLTQVSQTPLTQQQPVFFDRSGLTRQELLAQHVRAQQQAHQLPTQSLLTQQGLSVASQSQGAHHQMTQSQAHIPPNQVASPMAQQQVGHSVPQQVKLAGQVRMPHVPSPAPGPTSMSSNSMRAPTPSSGQLSSLTNQATVAPSPAPFVPSPAMHPSPSPQHYIVASPAPSTSVPTPSTMSVQSPASVPNPASVGAPAASPLNPAEEQAYLDKLNELKPYVEPLRRMINKMNRDMRDKEHSSRDLYKLKHLYDILTNPAKRLPLQALENSGNVLKKLINIKPLSVPTPPASSTPPGNTSSSIAATSSITTPTTATSGPAVPQAPSMVSTLPHVIYKPLYDAVTKYAKSPMLSHTLQRTFSPLLQAMEGPPILPLSPPAKRVKLDDSNQKKCTVPHVLQGELARLCSRFQVKSGASAGVIQSNTLLQCSINDLNLPAVPPIVISVPQNYPYSSPECKTANYDANPFLQKVQKQLSSRLQRMPEMYSVTSVLNAWESSIRQACNAEVAVN